MRCTIVILSLLLLWAGCSRNNPISPVNDTIQFDSLQVTFAIPRALFGVQDTLVATTTVYNPKADTVSLAIFNCNAIEWSVQDESGKTRLSSILGPQCLSLTEYSILPHQSQEIPQCRVVIAIVDLVRPQAVPSSYMLNAEDHLGTFSLKFAVN
jgi:hypothetical protein